MRPGLSIALGKASRWFEVRKTWGTWQKPSSSTRSFWVRPMLRSDNGKVFTSKRFVARCKQYGLEQEFTTPYSPQQNGMIERFFRSLKEECVWLYNFKTFKEAKETITAWIESYNNQRPHQALGYPSPAERRAQYQQHMA